MATKRHEDAQKRKRSEVTTSNSIGLRGKLPFLFVSFCVFSWPSSTTAVPFSFDDIEFWVGDGANRAAMVIDWVESATEPPALVWGYRWDGSARGGDMLAAIVAADPRLFAKLGGTRANPIAVYGLGYDADNDGEFGIDDGTQFDVDGFAFSGPADLAAATDAGDYYAEGWFTGFWHYGVAAANPYDSGSWADTPLGMAGRTLADGSWDSWVFSPMFDFSAFAENPAPAMPPARLSGDFNGDGRVAAADYVLWRAADLTPQGYAAWRTNFGASDGDGASSMFNAPEPTSGWIALVCLLAQFMLRSHHDHQGEVS